MKVNTLKITRIITALLFFISIVLFSCDFIGILPKKLHVLMHFQLIPAVLSGSFIILGVLLLLTILFGRVYCSTICPMGVLQDIIAWFSRRGKAKQKKKKGKKKSWYSYSKPYNILRYSLLTLAFLELFFGITFFLVILDPYSSFARISVDLFRPLGIEINNIINTVALKFDNYNFHHISLYTASLGSILLASISLLTVGVMAILRGRLYCNTICPVGTFLGLISKFSIFKIAINPDKCNQCGKCNRTCKSECIDYKNLRVDNSRCVDCYNCLSVCDKKAISYTTKRYQNNTKQVLEEKASLESKERRQFLLTSAGIATTLPIVTACSKIDGGGLTYDKSAPVTPPGSKSLARFQEKCTACHLCVTHCPQQILKPAGFTYGLNHAFKPELIFYEGAFCNYNCTVCSDVCPNGAIKVISAEEKKTIQIGVARFRRGRCVVITDGTSCGACSEHCPTQAVKMEPYKNGLTLPHVYKELCIGCGGCESICPVRPIKAINVVASNVHGVAQLPPEEEHEDVNIEDIDFGF